MILHLRNVSSSDSVLIWDIRFFGRIALLFCVLRD